MISFHTPQLPPPLNLDLKELDGGGSCPAQFSGETHDGGQVYVRYRGGYLRVDIAHKPGKEPGEGTSVLDILIGPPLDGEMSLAQFCRICGVTIQGSIPSETASPLNRYNDLSGRTTFWQASLPQVTMPTSRRMLATCWDQFPDALLVVAELDARFRCRRLVEVTPETLADHAAWLVDGAATISDIDSLPGRFILPRAGQLQIQMVHSLWNNPSPRFGSLTVERVEKELGRPMSVAGIRGRPDGEELAYDTFRSSAEFPTDDILRRDQLTELGDRLARFLPETRMQTVDLRTREVWSEQSMPLDPVIADWCREGTDRWLSIKLAENGSNWTGLQPKPE